MHPFPATNLLEHVALPTAEGAGWGVLECGFLPAGIALELILVLAVWSIAVLVDGAFAVLALEFLWAFVAFGEGRLADLADLLNRLLLLPRALLLLTFVHDLIIK
jgi:hypothetical protein